MHYYNFRGESRYLMVVGSTIFFLDESRGMPLENSQNGLKKMRGKSESKGLL